MLCKTVYCYAVYNTACTAISMITGFFPIVWMDRNLLGFRFPLQLSHVLNLSFVAHGFETFAEVSHHGNYTAIHLVSHEVLNLMVKFKRM